MKKNAVRPIRKRVRATHQYEVLGASSRVESFVGHRFHFIGIGGGGMSSLARVLKANGALVTGSDHTIGAATKALKAQGVSVSIGHDADALPADTQTVVFSAAVQPDNPELQMARQRGCRLFKYAHMLGELTNRYRTVAVCGTHGKSTTSAWLSFVLKQAGLDINYLVGASLSQLGGSSGVGQSDLFVVEACEYDRSFLNLRPYMACLLNIESDHLDYYHDEKEIVSAFSEFVAGIAHGGLLVCNGQDGNVMKVMSHCRPDVQCRTFGLDKTCFVRAHNLVLRDGLYHFDLYAAEQCLGRTHSPLPGRHNVLNALAVAGCALAVGLDAHSLPKLLPTFAGIERRIEVKGKVQGVTVLDDYAHHPTEIHATLEAIRERFCPRRLWCVFQPHQYSRTRFFLDDFAESFKLADLTIVPDIYSVRDNKETTMTVNARVLVERLRMSGSNALFMQDFTDICRYLESRATRDDVIVTLGAGDIWKVADEYIQRFGCHC